MTPVVAVAAAVALVPAALRWLRVAQREHYLPGAATRFGLRWARWRPENAVLAAVAAVSAVASWWWGPAGLLAAAVVAAWPVGLTVRGRTSPLRWTRRLRTLAAVVAVLAALTLLAGAPGLVTAAVLAPLLVDLGLAVTAPAERRLARRYVRQAERVLRAAAPTVVAITGSYGKTTTKGYARHLLAPVRQVVASPASFNNTAGLARTVNEHLTPGTEVLVAEMGMYRAGEIRDLCRWVRPTVGVITAIGPVHLERVGSIEGIAAAKAELLEGVDVAVLNVDAPHLAGLADRFAARGKVVRCSTADPTADVHVSARGDTLSVRVGGVLMAGAPAAGVHPSNVACAVGVAVALDVPHDVVARQLQRLPVTEHRQQVVTSAGGITVIDDTFNANPAGAAAGVALLAGAAGRKAVVTPGMVELGAAAEEENRRFAAAAAAAADDVVVVGRTNRAALLAGAGTGQATVHTVATRDEAVAWVRRHLGAGDAVLYENDLPDHYA